MNVNRSRLFLVLGIWLALTFTAHAFDDQQPPLLLAIAGDSTVATYAAGSAIHGWGEFLPRRLRRRVVVHNFAVPGASATSFLAKGKWTAALAEHPGVILVQFGHNEYVQGIGLAEYQANLQRLIGSARAQGAIPILVTPVQLHVFNRGQLVPSLQSYAAAMRQVAAQSNVALIDLHNLSGQLYTKLGPTATGQLASRPDDGIHFNTLGAQALAEIVNRELSQSRTPLAREIVLPTVLPSPAKKAAAPRRRTAGD